ncbi:MAG: VOC family protein [Paludibacteraceae bacterium]
MKLEHFALNVEQPVELAQWYVHHLGLKIISAQSVPPFGHFLADDSGRIMIEIYKQDAEIPNFPGMNPLTLHLAFVSEDPTSDMQRLVAAGAELVSDDKFDNGNHLVMLRDPWGISVQLCKRGNPLLTAKEF